MGKTYLISLLLTLAIAGAYWYQSNSAVCPVPLTYRIGNIDGSFNIEKEEAKQYAKVAEDLWESRVDRDLFVYDETAEFVIDFVFDERQQTADSQVALNNTLDQQRAENEKVMETVKKLQAEYESLLANHQAKVKAYEADLYEYNTTVNKYNDQGGAPPAVFEKLQSDLKSLDREAKKIADTAKELNDLVSEINRLADRGNELVEQYNQEVREYNKEFGFIGEFTQGDYQGDSIHVYKFSSGNELSTVVAHELGHALGIDHVEGSSSLMYYLLQDTGATPTLTTNDLKAYYEVCGARETFGQKVRRVIREFY
ncbi:matrixin family metalloprotease [Candidatus Kaiserbacteria bacterium]|nr:matrixin family metalloprotease [Candidatus Kaiserbacteria bacterium]USN92656.1 MAG: matrixin family metalloprotease [Candidatus Nomurabacteria bacterium]